MNSSMKIEKDKDDQNIYLVESSTSKGSFHKVDPDKPWCDCAHFRFRLSKSGGVCKHIIAVREFLAKSCKGTGDRSGAAQEILDLVAKQGEVDSVAIIEKYGEELVDKLITDGDLIEFKGKLRLLK